MRRLLDDLVYVLTLALFIYGIGLFVVLAASS